MKGCRDKAMLEVLYATGIRVSELINLNIDDVSITGGFIRCESGGRRESFRSIPRPCRRFIPLTTCGSRCWRILGAFLFVNVSGERMSRQGFWKIIKFYQEKRRSTRTSRRTRCGTALLRIC